MSSYLNEAFQNYISSLEDVSLQTRQSVGSGQEVVQLGVTLELPLSEGRLTYMYFRMIHSLVATLPAGSSITFVSERDVSIRLTSEQRPKAQTNELLSRAATGLGKLFDDCVSASRNSWWKSMDKPGDGK